MIFSTLYTGNLHLNITTPDHSDEVLNEIEPYVFEWTGLAIFYLQIRLFLLHINNPNWKIKVICINMSYHDF